MASLSQLAEDIFTCTLCLEKVRKPLTLPCLHVFCRYCLSAYVRQTIKDWSFPCPLCAQDTRPATKRLSSIDQWLETFPTSNFLQQLTRVLEARQSELACDICRQEQVLVEASAWCCTCMEAMCSDCHRVHARSRASRDHAVISVESLVSDPLEKLVGARGRPLSCPDHKGKTATLLCIDCKKLACETCIALSHSNCRRIEQADQVTPMLRKDVSSAKQHVQTQARAASHVTERLEGQLEQLRKSRDLVVEGVEALKKRLLDLIEMRYSQVLADVENLYSQQREGLVQRVGQSHGQEKVLSRTGRFLDLLLTYSSPAELLANFDNVLLQARVLEAQAAALKQGHDGVSLKFVPDKKTSETVKTLTSLGDVTLVRHKGRAAKDESKEKSVNRSDISSKQLAAPSPSLSPRKTSSFGKSPRSTPSRTPKVKMIASFVGRFNSDTMRSDLRGVVCLSCGDIIVMDMHFRNKRLKKFSGRGKLMSVLDTGECPYGMALVQDSELVVTHPRAREFVFVTAGGTLHVSGRTKTPKSYFSLAASSTARILAAVGANAPDPPTVDLISFDGEVLNTICLDRVRFPLPPKDVSLPTSGHVLLLFASKEMLVSMAYDGTVQHSFQNTQTVKKPVSMNSDVDGNAYVADLDGDKVHVITKEGKYGGELLSRKDGLREPLSLCWTDKGHMVVTQSNGDVKTYLV